MDILALNIKSLQYLFLWPEPNNKWTYFISRLTWAILIVLSVTQTVAAIVYQCIVNFEDSTVLFDAAIAMADFFGFGFVFVNFKLNAEKVKHSIEKITIFLNFCSKEVLYEAEKDVRLITKVFLLYICGGVIINSTIPMLEFKSCEETRLNDYYRIHDPCGMPVRTWYPFNSKMPAQHYFLVFIHAHACVVIVSTILCVTMTLIGFLIHIIAQLRHLREKFLQLFDKDVEDKAKCEQNLFHCIRYHVTIINYASEVFESFNLLLIVHVSLTSFVMGTLCFQIVYTENLTDKLRFMLHLGGWITMLFVTCYYGQQIINESLTIADGVFNSKWYNAELNNRKCIILIMVRSQKPLKLKAASISVLSLQTFLSITKTAYSYFTLLLSMEK